MTQTKTKALSEFLGVDADDIKKQDYNHYGIPVFSFGKGEFAVATEQEADAAARKDIEESLWAFNSDFIIDHSKLPYEALEMIKSFQESKCEDANETIKALIKDMDKFVADAISADGRGHFLNSYDGAEHEQGDYYIYRIN